MANIYKKNYRRSPLKVLELSFIWLIINYLWTTNETLRILTVKKVKLMKIRLQETPLGNFVIIARSQKKKITKFFESFLNMCICYSNLSNDFIEKKKSNRTLKCSSNVTWLTLESNHQTLLSNHFFHNVLWRNEPPTVPYYV